MIGQILDSRYQVKEILGEGGFGKTFLAEDTKRPSNPICVVKQFHPNFSAPGLLEKAKDLFNQEAETLEILGKHSNIPTLLAYFEEDGEFYIVQEYIAGHTLEQELIPNQPLSEQQVVDIVAKILEILKFVHAHNVIHRDIKPENIIRRKKDNELFLIDFGSVKRVTRQSQKLTTHIGTDAYMSAEQFKRQTNFCSDLYAVGMIGIQALTGVELQPVYGGGFSLDEQGEINWRKGLNISKNLADFLTKMVRNNYIERYQSAEEAFQIIQGLGSKNNALQHIPKKIVKPISTLVSKILIYGGIFAGTLIMLLTIHDTLNKQKSYRELPLNGKLIERVLNDEDICENNLKIFYCEQYFFEGKKGQKIVIEMNSNDFKPDLVLFQPNNDELAYHRKSAPDDWTAQIAVTLPQDGTYTLLAKNFSTEETGSYTLQAVRRY